MYKPITAIIEWYGPYTFEEAQSVSKFDYGDGLYLVIGKTAYQRKSNIQYIGLAKNLGRRLNGYHHALHKVTRDREIWLGEVVSPRTPGKKMKVTDTMLDLAEWSHAYYLQVPLNNKKRKKPPYRPVVTYNRWWKTDYGAPYLRRPHADWPDLIDHVGDGYPSKVIWFGGKQIRQCPEYFREE